MSDLPVALGDMAHRRNLREDRTEHWPGGHLLDGGHLAVVQVVEGQLALGEVGLGEVGSGETLLGHSAVGGTDGTGG